MQKPIKCVELAEIKSFDDGKQSFRVIRVVAWNDGDPVIEKRWFSRKAMTLQTGRACGFTLADLEYVAARLPQIKALIERGEGIGEKIK